MKIEMIEEDIENTVKNDRLTREQKLEELLQAILEYKKNICYTTWRKVEDIVKDLTNK